MRPTVLTIAGSDCSGGAGIQADLKTVEANRGYGASVITAVTAQNTSGVQSSFVLPPARVAAQLDAVLDDLPVLAVKTGMLGDGSIVSTVSRRLVGREQLHYVCDPVLVSSSGFPLLDGDGIDRLLRELVPLASVVTPNVDEARALTGIAVASPDDARLAGERLLELGARAVLITGGHLSDRPATDVLVTPAGHRAFGGEFVDQPNRHGSGCTFSSALATLLARGFELPEAVGKAKRFVTEAIRHGLPLGSGRGPTDPFFFLHAGRATGGAS